MIYPRNLVLLGHPVRQARLPQLMREWTGYAVLRCEDVTPDALGLRITQLQADPAVDGIIITVPHKQAALRYASLTSDSGQAAGAINALTRTTDGEWIGANFDGRGFVDGLRARGRDLDGAAVFLNGMGGAGSAIALELLSAGVGSLYVYDPDRTTARAKIDRFPVGLQCRIVLLHEPKLLEYVDVAVNASPLGMLDDGRLSFDPLAVASVDTLICDIVMEPEWTPLLRQARALGFSTQPGIVMLRHQREALLDFFGIAD